MVGVIACRNRWNGPNPGQMPKIAGAAEMPYESRFFWCTKRPPLRSDRTQNGRGSTFPSDTLGVILNLFGNNGGSTNDGFQSMSVRNVFANTRVCFCAVSAPGYTTF